MMIPRNVKRWPISFRTMAATCCPVPIRPRRQRWEQSRFDLVLLDLKMTGVNGLDLLRRIRHLSHGCILILTGMVEAHIKRMALSEGADAVLTKPVDIPQLLGIARDVQTTGDCKATAPLVPAP